MNVLPVAVVSGMLYVSSTVSAAPPEPVSEKKMYDIETVEVPHTHACHAKNQDGVQGYGASWSYSQACALAETDCKTNASFTEGDTCKPYIEHPLE